VSYRRHQVLAVGTDHWDIQAEWQLRGNTSPPSPDNRIRFCLELIARLGLAERDRARPSARTSDD
jgi:hypothetical protein